MVELAVETDGQLTLPAPYLARRGLKPGAKFYVESFEDGLRLHRVRPDARKAYIEITARCNLNCAVCVRQVWTDAPGDMSWETYRAVIEGLRAFPDLRQITLGGYGEPLVHPRFPEMLALASELQIALTLTTNGLLLDEAMAEWGAWRQCRFIGDRAVVIGWDGGVSPCYPADAQLPLLYLWPTQERHPLRAGQCERATPGRHLAIGRVCALPGQSARLSFHVVRGLRRGLRLCREQRGLPGQRAFLRRLPVGAGYHSLPVKTHTK